MNPHAYDEYAAYSAASRLSVEFEVSGLRPKPHYTTNTTSTKARNNPFGGEQALHWHDYVHPHLHTENKLHLGTKKAKGSWIEVDYNWIPMAMAEFRWRLLPRSSGQWMWPAQCGIPLSTWFFLSFHMLSSSRSAYIFRHFDICGVPRLEYDINNGQTNADWRWHSSTLSRLCVSLPYAYEMSLRLNSHERSPHSKLLCGELLRLRIEFVETQKNTTSTTARLMQFNDDRALHCHDHVYLFLTVTNARHTVFAFCVVSLYDYESELFRRPYRRLHPSKKLRQWRLPAKVESRSSHDYFFFSCGELLQSRSLASNIRSLSLRAWIYRARAELYKELKEGESFLCLLCFRVPVNEYAYLSPSVASYSAVQLGEEGDCTTASALRCWAVVKTEDIYPRGIEHEAIWRQYGGEQANAQASLGVVIWLRSGGFKLVIQVIDDCLVKPYSIDLEGSSPNGAEPRSSALRKTRE